MANILTDPPFAADPPIKVNIPAKTVGIVAAILGILELIFFGLFGLFAAFALTTLATVCDGLTNCNTGGIFFLALVGVIVDSGRLAALPHRRLPDVQPESRRQEPGHLRPRARTRRRDLLELIGGLGAGGFIFDIIWFVVGWYIVVISRWPGDAPLVAAGPTGGYGNPPGGYGSPPPPPPPSA